MNSNASHNMKEGDVRRGRERVESSTWNNPCATAIVGVIPVCHTWGRRRLSASSLKARDSSVFIYQSTFPTNQVQREERRIE